MYALLAKTLITLTILSGARDQDQSYEEKLKAAETAMLADFGREVFLVMDGAMLFIDGDYVAPPYTVERRGLNVYVNGHPWRVSIYWPPLKEKPVYHDPGPPPPYPIIPCRLSDWMAYPEGGWTREKVTQYWCELGFYLEQEYGYEKAVYLYHDKILEAQAKSGNLWTLDPEDPQKPNGTRIEQGLYYCHNKTGLYSLFGMEKSVPWETPEERGRKAIAETQKTVQNCITDLSYPQLLLRKSSGLEGKTGGKERIAALLDVLSSAKTPDEKRSALKALDLRHVEVFGKVIDKGPSDVMKAHAKRVLDSLEKKRHEVTRGEPFKFVEVTTDEEEALLTKTLKEHPETTIDELVKIRNDLRAQKAKTNK